MTRTAVQFLAALLLGTASLASTTKTNATIQFDDRCLKRGLLDIEEENKDAALDALVAELEAVGWACEEAYEIVCSRQRRQAPELWSSDTVCKVAGSEYSYIAYYRLVRTDTGETSYGAYAFHLQPPIADTFQ